MFARPKLPVCCPWLQHRSTLLPVAQRSPEGCLASVAGGVLVVKLGLRSMLLASVPSFSPPLCPPHFHFASRRC